MSNDEGRLHVSHLLILVDLRLLLAAKWLGLLSRFPRFTYCLYCLVPGLRNLGEERRSDGVGLSIYLLVHVVLHGFEDVTATHDFELVLIALSLCFTVVVAR